MAYISLETRDEVKSLITRLYSNLPPPKQQYFQLETDKCIEVLNNKNNKRIPKDQELFFVQIVAFPSKQFYLLGWETVCREFNFKHESLKTKLSMTKNNLIVTRFNTRLLLQRTKQIVLQKDIINYDIEEGCLQRYLKNEGVAFED